MARKVGMKILKYGGVTLVSLLALAAGGLQVRAWSHERRLSDMEAQLKVATGATFSPSMVADLPAPAQQYFLHAIKPGTPLARTLRAQQSARMKPAPDKPHVDITSAERLTPRKGFVWRAEATMGLPVKVTDHYFANEGSVDIALLGLVPIASDSGPDIDKSAKGRLAMESLWCPSALLPGEGVRWEPVDDERARVIQSIDGEEIPITLKLDADGRVLEATMLRWGNVGRPDFGPVPYGFAVVEEGTFGGQTICTKLKGGWQYGTDAFDPAAASEFTIRDVVYE